MADKIQHELRYSDKTAVFGHVEDKFEVGVNSTMKIYPHASTRSRFDPEKKLALCHISTVSRPAQFRNRMSCVHITACHFSFSFVSLFTFVKVQITSHVNWHI